jgi:hypothetical protein
MCVKEKRVRERERERKEISNAFGADFHNSQERKRREKFVLFLLPSVFEFHAN